MKFYRQYIKLIDYLIISFISFRFKVCLILEKKKRKLNIPVYIPEVEAKKLEIVKKVACRKKLNSLLVESLFRLIIKESVNLQNNQRNNLI